jgi:hypothetical protein
LGTYRGFAQQGPLTSRLKRKFFYPNSGKNTPMSENTDKSRSGVRIEYAEISATERKSSAAQAPSLR